MTQAIAQCEQLIAEGLTDRQVECMVICKLAQLKAMNGELESARGLFQQGRTMLRDLGQGVDTASTGIDLVRVELHGGDLTIAEREARADYEAPCEDRRDLLPVDDRGAALACRARPRSRRRSACFVEDRERRPLRQTT